MSHDEGQYQYQFEPYGQEPGQQFGHYGGQYGGNYNGQYPSSHKPDKKAISLIVVLSVAALFLAGTLIFFGLQLFTNTSDDTYSVDTANKKVKKNRNAKKDDRNKIPQLADATPGGTPFDFALPPGNTMTAHSGAAPIFATSNIHDGNFETTIFRITDRSVKKMEHYPGYIADGVTEDNAIIHNDEAYFAVDFDTDKKTRICDRSVSYQTNDRFNYFFDGETLVLPVKTSAGYAVRAYDLSGNQLYETFIGSDIGYFAFKDNEGHNYFRVTDGDNRMHIVNKKTGTVPTTGFWGIVYYDGVVSMENHTMKIYDEHEQLFATIDMGNYNSIWVYANSIRDVVEQAQNLMNKNPDIYPANAMISILDGKTVIETGFPDGQRIPQHFQVNNASTLNESVHCDLVEVICYARSQDGSSVRSLDLSDPSAVTWKLNPGSGSRQIKDHILFPMGNWSSGIGNDEVMTITIVPRY